MVARAASTSCTWKATTGLHRRQRFDAKEESIEKRRHLGNAERVQHVQCSKDKIDKEVDAKNYAGESRPAQGQDQMVRISPIERLGIELHKFKLTGPDPDVVWSSPHK
jgi:hypothetical protein